MNELDKIARAKMYLEKLANGINPLTDENVMQNDIVNNARISRCMFYVSDILRQILENGGNLKIRLPEKSPFYITPEQLSRFEYSEYPIAISDITQRINNLIDLTVIKNLKYGSITSWLVDANILEVITKPNGKTTKRPTSAGREKGIITETRIGKNGEYTAILYNRNAQRFILDNIDAIIHINNEKKIKSDVMQPSTKS